MVDSALILKGKTALVTGAGQGIGQAIAQALAEQGAKVGIIDYDPEAARNAAREMKDQGFTALALFGDVVEAGQVKVMVDQARKELGPVDILVNNAGTAGSSCLVKDMPLDSWARTLSVNLTGAFNCCQAVIPDMIQAGQGRIVNIASIAGRRMSKLGGADYTASKWGLIGFSKHLAFELAANRINVNVVCPGVTLTPMVEAKASPEFLDQVAAQVPLGRLLSPQDQAQAVLFPVGPGSKMLTGQVIEVEGGQLLGLASDYKEDLARRVGNSTRNLKKYMSEQGDEK